MIYSVADLVAKLQEFDQSLPVGFVVEFQGNDVKIIPNEVKLGPADFGQMVLIK